MLKVITLTTYRKYQALLDYYEDILDEKDKEIDFLRMELEQTSIDMANDLRLKAVQLAAMIRGESTSAGSVINGAEEIYKFLIQ